MNPFLLPRFPLEPMKEAYTTMRKLAKVAEERGVPLDVLIPQTIQEEGSVFQAAKRLGVYPSAIQYWMKKHGYKLVSRRVAELQKESVRA
jgi:hypothetical protein